jgi:Peptidase inhibitor I78 family
MPGTIVARLLMRIPCVLANTITAGWLLAACGPNDVTTPSAVRSPDSGGSTPPLPPPISGSCDASRAQFAIAQPASADLLEHARLAAQASSARFIRPNQPITTEYLGSRLNLGLDRQDVVASVNCG